MKTILIATAVMLGIASSGALAHGDGEKEMRHGKSGSGHADMVGKPGDLNNVSRTIEVIMSDNMRFTPSTASVKRGETVKFVVKNAGQVRHEMVLGTAKELAEHAKLMRKFPGMEHDDPNQVSVEPGKTGTFVWQFTRAGVFEFACLEPGHMEAGMVGKVAVSK
ncbi:MAG TPA: cupredoxin family protein [Burkholderiales bacterium]|nr:cupredoxin family protein [Burkholderiales bacterium]